MDDFSRYTWLYFLITKRSSIILVCEFSITNQLNTPIKYLQYINRGEFISFPSYFENHGIVHRFSYPHTPQQNGRAEREIRHVIETRLALSAQASLPSKFLMQAFHNATYFINLLPSKVLLNQSPTQLLFNKSPNYAHLCIFGCLCFPSLRP